MELTDNERLVFAARAGNIEEIRLLIERGADPNGPKDELGAPLFAAFAATQMAAVRSLLEWGASVSVIDRQGDGPLEYSLHLQNDESTIDLLSHGARLNPHSKNTYRSLLEETLKRLNAQTSD
jgi:ankyrin repeat protein